MTKAFLNDKRMLPAFNRWLTTKSGKDFVKLYGKGGKYSHISVVFDIGDLPYINAKAEALTELVNINDPSKTQDLNKYEGKPNNSIPGIKNVVNGQSTTEYLKFTLLFGGPSFYESKWKDCAVDVDDIIHEKQHMDLALVSLANNCKIWSHPDTHSGNIRTVILETSGQPFWKHPDSDSGIIRT